MFLVNLPFVFSSLSFSYLTRTCVKKLEPAFLEARAASSLTVKCRAGSCPGVELRPVAERIPKEAIGPGVQLRWITMPDWTEAVGWVMVEFNPEAVEEYPGGRSSSDSYKECGFLFREIGHEYGCKKAGVSPSMLIIIRLSLYSDSRLAMEAS
ncbi:hypothetical protein BGX38DRAFT_597844 [Terfezia claveryi]|nr:hypothetical protein BGX38DRAFT_597844 [Terfezia claveryi]